MVVVTCIEYFHCAGVMGLWEIPRGVFFPFLQVVGHKSNYSI